MTSHRPLIVDDGLIARLGDGDTLMLPTVTALRLLGVDGNKAVISVNLAAFLRSASAAIIITDNGAGGVTISLPQTLTVKLLGDNDAVVAGSASDPAWDGVAPSATWTAIWKAVVARLEAVRVLLTGTLKIDGSAVTQPVSPKQFSPTSTVKVESDHYQRQRHHPDRDHGATHLQLRPVPGVRPLGHRCPDRDRQRHADRLGGL
ncbi:hypothetical protein WCLP8_3160003 [uncultured Gammaproteobacteria bacterium]